MEVVKHLRVPVDIRVQYVARQREREPHRVAVVVVGNVLAPVEGAGPVLVRVGEVPAIHVDVTIASIHLDDRGHERDDLVPDLLDVGALVDREPIHQLHQRRG